MEVRGTSSPGRRQRLGVKDGERRLKRDAAGLVRLLPGPGCLRSCLYLRSLRGGRRFGRCCDGKTPENRPGNNCAAATAGGGLVGLASEGPGALKRLGHAGVRKRPGGEKRKQPQRLSTASRAAFTTGHSINHRFIARIISVPRRA